MLLRPTCVLCDRPGSAICEACASGLLPAPSLAVPLELDACHALLDYHSARTLITSLKNRGRRDLIGWLATEMLRQLDVPPGAVVSWPPTSPARRRTRGYDQAELLACAVARRHGLECQRLLRRSAGPAQAGRSAAERATHPGFVSRLPSPPAVVLIDDVITTGATLTAAARALRAAGATTVVAVVAARAPVPTGARF